MGRLRTMKPAVKAMAPRLGYAPGDEAARDRSRVDAEPWRRWYRTARWQKLRREVFARDLYVCQRTGDLCTGKGNDPMAPVANHKVPHRGDPKLFWDPANLETVAKHVHDGEIQREERRAQAAR